MSNWTLLFPSGAPTKKIFPAAKMATLDEWLLNVPNWIGGSDHTLDASTSVVLRGASTTLFRVIAPSKFDHITTATVDADGTITFTGTSGHEGSAVFANHSGAVWQSGSFATFETNTNAVFNSGSSLSIEAGAHAFVQSIFGVEFTGTQPAYNDDPGADNIAIGLNQSKAFCNVSVGGGVTTIHDGYNILSVTISSLSVAVLFKRPLADGNYSVTWGVEIINVEVIGSGYIPQPFLDPTGGTKTANGFKFTLWDGSAIIDPAGASVLKVHFDVKGRQ